MEARQWSRLSNYVRLHALREEGGIYLDTDIEILRSLDPLLKYPCFVPFQQKKMSPDWINNAALGAEAGHPFLTRCLAATDEAFRLRGVFLRQPLVSTAVLKEMGLRRYDFQECGGVTILPHESFYPYPWYARFSPECITPSTYGIHHWEASWHADPLSRLIHRVRCWRHSLGARLSRGR
jgi:mannosyltransferase OCH1-like enzyme